jgi:hypothetical protein
MKRTRGGSSCVEKDETQPPSFDWSPHTEIRKAMRKLGPREMLHDSSVLIWKTADNVSMTQFLDLVDDAGQPAITVARPPMAGTPPQEVRNESKNPNYL